MLRAALVELPSRTSWNTRYDELTSYKQRHGHTSVPKAHGALGRWVARQRELAKNNMLAPDRRSRLEQLGFVWNTNDEAWEARYHQLLAWAADHGHACVPIAEGDIGLWVAKQRQMNRKGKLAPDRKALLDHANFTWDTPSADWNEKYADLVRFKESHGHCRVPFNSPDGLGWWVNTQRQARRKSKLSRERQERLDAIGFVWNPQHTFRAATRRRIDDHPSGTAATTAPSSVATTPVAGPPTARLTRRVHSFSGHEPSATLHADHALSTAISAAGTGSFGWNQSPAYSDRPTPCIGASNILQKDGHGTSPTLRRSQCANDHHIRDPVNRRGTACRPLLDRPEGPVTRRVTPLGMFTPPYPSSTASPTLKSGGSTPTGDSPSNIGSAVGSTRATSWERNGSSDVSVRRCSSGLHNLRSDETIAGSSGTLTVLGSSGTLNYHRSAGTPRHGGSSGVLTIDRSDSAKDINVDSEMMQVGGSSGSLSVGRMKTFSMEVCSPAQSSSPAHSMALMTVLPPLKMPINDGPPRTLGYTSSGLPSVAVSCRQEIAGSALSEHIHLPIADVPEECSGLEQAGLSLAALSSSVRSGPERHPPSLDHILHGPEGSARSSAAKPHMFARRNPPAQPDHVENTNVRPHMLALPPLWTFGDAIVSNSPRRRRKPLLSDDRRTVSFSSSWLDSGKNSGNDADLDRSSSLEPQRSMFPNIRGVSFGPDGKQSEDKDTIVDAQNFPLREKAIVPLADLATPAVSPEVIAARTRMATKLPSIQEMCAQDPSRFDPENAQQLRRLDRFG